MGKEWKGGRWEKSGRGVGGKRVEGGSVEKEWKGGRWEKSGRGVGGKRVEGGSVEKEWKGGRWEKSGRGVGGKRVAHPCAPTLKGPKICYVAQSVNVL